MTAPIVGIVGRKGSGKDTAAAGLYPLGYTRRGFADPLKTMALAIDPMIDMLDAGERFLAAAGPTFGAQRLSKVIERGGWESAKTVPDVRRFLQRLGTDAVRTHISDYAWVVVFLAAWHKAGRPLTVVPDVRFANEADAIRDSGGVLIRIDRPGLPTDDHHPSEAIDAIPVHFVVVNDAAPEDMQAQVVQIAQGWPDDVNVDEARADVARLLGGTP